MKLIIVITLLLSLTSCANKSQYSEEVMFDMASILKDVAQAVDGELKFGEIYEANHRYHPSSLIDFLR